MNNATFHNFSSEPFTGYWNGKPKTFKAGERVYMPAYLAEHFAKHLTNRELQKTAKGENYTSPKFPRQVPEFMEMFNKAFIPEKVIAGETEIDREIASATASKGMPSMNIDVKAPANIDEGPAAAQAAIASEKAPEELDIHDASNQKTGPGSAPQIIGTPDGDDDDFDHGNK